MSRRTRGEGSIFQRKDKRWTAQFYINGEKKTKTYRTQAEAKEKLLEVKNALRQGNYCDPHGMTLGEWFDEWLENYARPSIKLSTYISYETYVRAHIKPAIGQVKMKDLNVELLQHFITGKSRSGRADNRKGGLSAKTIKNILIMLHEALKQAVENGLIPRNYAEGVHPPKAEEKEMRVLSREEQQALMKVCRESGNPACFGIIFALFTGVRIGELLGLRWNSVDFANHIFSVKVSLNRLKTFDENSPTATTLEPRTPKTKNSKRSIDIIDELYADLVEHKRQQDELAAEFPGYNSKGYVFVTAEGNRFDPRTFQDLFHREVKAAGIENANFHCLRHTFATRSIENGMDILVLSKVLGHAKPSTTLNMYGHVLTEHKKDSMQKISSLYSAPISTVKQQEQDKGLILSL